MKLSLRILASLMALLLIMGLAACGGTEDPQSSSAPESSETGEPVSDESSEPDAPESSEPDAPESSEPDAPESSEPEEDDKPTTTEGEDEPTTTEKEEKPTTEKKDEGDGKKTSNTKKSSTSRTKKSTTTGKKTTTGEKKTTTAAQKETSLTWAQVKKNIPSSAKGKTLTVYDWNPESEVPGMAQVNKNFEKETGITIDYKLVNHKDYFTKITAQVAANTPPDAVRLQNINRQNLVSLQPFNNTGYNFNDTYWDDTVMNAYTYNGNIYGINMVDSPYVCPAIMYYNKNLIDTYNLDDPYELWKDGKWTWDKVWDMCEEFVDEANGDDFTGLTSMAFDELAIAEGIAMATFDTKTSKATSHLTDAKYIKAWETYADKYDDGLVAQAWTDNDGFDKGNILFSLSMQIASRTGSQYFMRLRKQGAVACVPLPAKKAGGKDYQRMGEMQAMGIPKGAKNADLVPYYARYYYDVKNYDMDTFFNVDHAAEVTEYIMNSNPIIEVATIMTEENCGMDNTYLMNSLKQSGKENVKMKIDSIAPMFDMAVADFNNFLAGL